MNAGAVAVGEGDEGMLDVGADGFREGWPAGAPARASDPPEQPPTPRVIASDQTAADRTVRRSGGLRRAPIARSLGVHVARDLRGIPGKFQRKIWVIIAPW